MELVTTHLGLLNLFMHRWIASLDVNQVKVISDTQEPKCIGDAQNS